MKKLMSGLAIAAIVAGFAVENRTRSLTALITGTILLPVAATARRTASSTKKQDGLVLPI